MWTCISARPGRRYRPRASTRCAPGSTRASVDGPAQTIRPCDTSTVWSASATSRSIGSTVACSIARVSGRVEGVAPGWVRSAMATVAMKQRMTIPGGSAVKTGLGKLYAHRGQLDACRVPEPDRHVAETCGSRPSRIDVLLFGQSAGPGQGYLQQERQRRAGAEGRAQKMTTRNLRSLLLQLTAARCTTRPS